MEHWWLVLKCIHQIDHPLYLASPRPAPPHPTYPLAVNVHVPCILHKPWCHNGTLMTCLKCICQIRRSSPLPRLASPRLAPPHPTHPRPLAVNVPCILHKPWRHNGTLMTCLHTPYTADKDRCLPLTYTYCYSQVLPLLSNHHLIEQRQTDYKSVPFIHV